MNKTAMQIVLDDYTDATDSHRRLIIHQALKFSMKVRDDLNLLIAYLEAVDFRENDADNEDAV